MDPIVATPRPSWTPSASAAPSCARAWTTSNAASPRPPSGRAVVWGEAVHDALATLAADFGAHVEVTEGPDGLHQAILAGDLRLANAVDG